MASQALVTDCADTGSLHIMDSRRSTACIFASPRGDEPGLSSGEMQSARRALGAAVQVRALLGVDTMQTAGCERAHPKS
jgi:hypothetical protein